jgi:hypothetical protein
MEPGPGGQEDNENQRNPDRRKKLQSGIEAESGYVWIRDHDGNMELSGNLYLQEEKYGERFAET